MLLTYFASINAISGNPLISYQNTHHTITMSIIEHFEGHSSGLPWLISGHQIHI